MDGILEESLELAGNGSVVVRREENGYFLLKASYENGESEEILFYVCPEVAA